MELGGWGVSLSLTLLSLFFSLTLWSYWMDEGS